MGEVTEGSLVNCSAHLKIIVKNLIEILVLVLCLRHNHWEVEGNCTEIKSTLINGSIILVCGVHSSSFIPRTQICSATHSGNSYPVLLIHTRSITVSSTRNIVRIHSLSGTINCFIKEPFIFIANSVLILIIEKTNLREKYGVLKLTNSLAILSHLQARRTCKSFKLVLSKAQTNRGKRIVASGTRN